MRPSSPEESTTADKSPWAEVKALFEQALALHGRDRELFLESSCASSSQLKQEIQSLLEHYQETDDFLEQPVVSIQALLDSDLTTAGTSTIAVTEEETQIGARIGAYRIEQEIGRGGMGEVYLATRADSEFDKRVAIKLIRDGSQTGLAILRFRRERQILARLENAYIARLLDGGTTSYGLPYFVMEYVEGKPIHQYCDEHSLTVRERLSLFLKVCSAVQYAHERNIIHRDLKPGNILVKKDGTPKLLDFGIAKILQAESSGAEQDLTHHTSRMLTPAYASPEQLRDGAATVRSDVYSLGVVLYELLCGKRPEDWFSHRQQTSPPCPQEAHLSPPLRAIIRRSIHPDPSERYESVASFTADVRRYLSGAPPVADSPEGMGNDSTKVSLAVVPFRILGDQSSANAFLAPGLTETLITKLSRIKRLSISPPSAVLKYADGVEAVRAARELHVEYILEGSLYIFRESVRATVQLVFAEAGIAVWAGEVEATEKTLSRLGDAIAEQVAQAVLPHLTGEERAQISRSGTNNGAAYTAYLRGRWHWTNSGDQETLLKALVCFREAIDLDPGFARAHAGVADYYLRIGLWGGLPPSESFAAAIESAQRAVKLEPTLAEAHASLAFAIWAYHRDEELAEKHFSLAIVRNPNYASAHHWFGLLNSARNRPELGIANLERAAKVDPNSVLIAAALGFVHYNARQFDTALQLLLNAARELPKSGIVQEMLTWCYLRLGDVPAALESGARAVQLGDRSSAALSALAHAEAAAQNRAAALQLRNEIEERTRTMHVSSYDRASAALAVGQPQQALSHLEQARADRDWWLCWIEVDPRWDPLRHEQRFKKLLPQRGSPRRNRFAPVYATAACAALVIVVLLAWWMARRPPTPFANVKFTKLTTNGTAESAVISPDGKVVVYAAKELRGTALWRYNVPSGRAVKLAEGLSGKLMDLGFTAHGAAVQYVTFPLKGPANRTLTILPVAGGSPTTIAQTFQGPVSLSPDARQAAFYYSDMVHGIDQLRRLDLKSGKQLQLASYKYPLRFAWNLRPAWSSDGKRLAYASEERDKLGFLVRLRVLDVATGVQHEVSSPRWQWVESIAWKSDNSGFAVVGQRHESSFQQIWYIPYPTSRGGIRRIGNDLDDYIGASLTESGSEIVSVQFQTLSNIYIAKPGNPSRAVQVTPGSGRYFDLAWAPDGRILYASDATGSADLWIMNADGTGQRQITSHAGRNYAPVASPDSRSVVFHSNRTGNWQVWRTNIDGTEPKQLSNSAGDGNWPQFTMGGQTVLFHKTNLNGVFNLWQVPAKGGDAQQITTGLTMHPAVSPWNGDIAAWYSDTQDTPNWRIGIFSRTGGDPLRVLNPPPNAKPDTPIRWMPKGDAIAVMDYTNSASNIYAVPLDGSPPRSLTSFDSGEIFSFDWSRDGRLLYSRGLSTSDVVLIQDLKPAEALRE